MKSRFDPEFPFNRKPNIKPGSNAQKWFQSLYQGDEPAPDHHQHLIKKKLMDLSDSAFKLSCAAELHNQKAGRRRIPIEFRPQYEPEYLNQKQVAERFSISVRTVQRWMKHGWLPFCRVNRRVHFNWAHIMDSLDRFFRFPPRPQFNNPENHNYEN